MRHFELVNDDHAGFIDPTAIALRCKVIKKFIPYDGFYPSQRSLQLAKQFYKSYGDYFKNLESYVVETDDPTDLTGDPAKVQIRIFGERLYAYYEQNTQTQNLSLGSYYSGFVQGSNWFSRGIRAPITAFGDEAATPTQPVVSTLGMSVEAGSIGQGNTSIHPKNLWALPSGYDYDHHDKVTSNDNTSDEVWKDSYGFIVQDADQRKCVYIQLVDERVWRNFKPDNFYDGVVRNFMFPLADIDESGSKYRQPLLIKDSNWTYLGAHGRKLYLVPQTQINCRQDTYQLFGFVHMMTHQMI